MVEVFSNVIAIVFKNLLTVRAGEKDKHGTTATRDSDITPGIGVVESPFLSVSVSNIIPGIYE